MYLNDYAQAHVLRNYGIFAKSLNVVKCVNFVENIYVQYTCPLSVSLSLSHLEPCAPYDSNFASKFSRLSSLLCFVLFSCSSFLHSSYQRRVSISKWMFNQFVTYKYFDMMVYFPIQRLNLFDLFTSSLSFGLTSRILLDSSHEATGYICVLVAGKFCFIFDTSFSSNVKSE